MAEQECLLPADVLANSPSRAEGVSEEDEWKHRVFGCELIQEAGILLRLPQVVMATGQTLYHRFFYRTSLKKFDAFQVAMGSIFLAAKIEEQPKRLKQVLTVFYHINLKRRKLQPKPLEINGQRYVQWNRDIIKTERVMLRELGYRLYGIMEHPHKFILYYVKILEGTGELAQKSWNYLNDSLRTDCCVRYRSQAIACAAIFMAARVLQIKLPDNPPWWDLFETTEAEIVEISNRVLALYNHEKIEWLDGLVVIAPRQKSSTTKGGTTESRSSSKEVFRRRSLSKESSRKGPRRDPEPSRRDNGRRPNGTGADTSTNGTGLRKELAKPAKAPPLPPLPPEPPAPPAGLSAAVAAAAELSKKVLAKSSDTKSSAVPSRAPAILGGGPTATSAVSAEFKTMQVKMPENQGNASSSGKDRSASESRSPSRSRERRDKSKGHKDRKRSRSRSRDRRDRVRDRRDRDRDRKDRRDRDKDRRDRRR